MSFGTALRRKELLGELWLQQKKAENRRKGPIIEKKCKKASYFLPTNCICLSFFVRFLAEKRPKNAECLIINALYL